ncbi:MAG: holo-ACP synthase [Bacilli bacterium]
MNIRGIGIDIVDISRIKGKSKLAERILSPKEFLAYQASSIPDDYLASRFAVKEAYVKASGDKTVDYRNLETIDDENGKPHLFLNGKEVLGYLSLAHDLEAVAVLILME